MRFFQRDLLLISSPFESLSRASVVDQDPPHELRCNSKEVCPVLPVGSTLTNQPQKGFVDERRGLQRVSDSLPLEVPSGLSL